MKTLTTLLLTLGLCGLSLPAFAGPSCDANADESLNVMDIVAIVDAVLNPDTTSANCAGPGCDECADITSDNAEVIAAATEGMYTQAQMDEAVAAATPDPAPNCFLMGLCGQDGAASYGIPGPYSQMSSSDALFEGSLCEEEYWGGSSQFSSGCVQFSYYNYLFNLLDACN